MKISDERLEEMNAERVLSAGPEAPTFFESMAMARELRAARKVVEVAQDIAEVDRELMGMKGLCPSCFRKDGVHLENCDLWRMAEALAHYHAAMEEQR